MERKVSVPAMAKIQAIVGEVKGEPENRFAVTYPTENFGLPKGTTITFSLIDWEGENEPRHGQVVVLENIQLFAKGWRALSARPIGIECGGTNQEIGRRKL